MFKTLSTLLLCAALIAGATTAQPTEDLIGEELINKTTVFSFANRAIAEAERIWLSGSDNGWVTISATNGILNEGKAVGGVFAAAGVTVTRTSAVVNTTAQALFDYLITAEGYQLIDPFSDPTHFDDPPLESFSTETWRGASSSGKKLEVARTESPFAGLTTREYVVLNAIDANTRIFVSKSVQHSGDAGCSAYGGSECYDASAVPIRALNMFAVQIEPVHDNEAQCTVQLINYADLTPPEIPAFVQNYVNADFLPAVITRMRAVYP